MFAQALLSPLCSQHLCLPPLELVDHRLLLALSQLDLLPPLARLRLQVDLLLLPRAGRCRRLVDLLLPQVSLLPRLVLLLPRRVDRHLLLVPLRQVALLPRPAVQRLLLGVLLPRPADLRLPPVVLLPRPADLRLPPWVLPLPADLHPRLVFLHPPLEVLFLLSPVAHLLLRYILHPKVVMGPHLLIPYRLEAEAHTSHPSYHLPVPHRAYRLACRFLLASLVQSLFWLTDFNHGQR